MGVNIKKIELQNYRQYKNVSIDFFENNSNNLHVLKAKNGTGKTTFLNSITWCLYGEEKYINDANNALSLPNEKEVENTEENGSVKVIARLTIEDDDTNQIMVFTREERYRVNFDIINKNKKAIVEQRKFYIALTKLNDTSNSVIIDDEEECKRFVDIYFNRTIFDYYFFDGENLKNYFAKSKGETIQTAIFNISQVTLLENTRARTNELGVKISRTLKRKKPSEINYYEEKVNIENDIKSRENKIRQLEKDIEQYSENKAQADSILNNYGPIKTQQLRKKDLDRMLEKNTKELENLRNEQYEFIQEYLVLLNFYPRIKNTYEMICNKEKNNELPPNIDKREIKEIIDKHLTNCPVCNSKIDDDAISYLQKLLDQTAVSTGTSHQLMLIKSSLEQMMDEVSNYKSKKNELVEIEKNLLAEKKNYEKELEGIHSYLSNYSTNDLEKDISQAESDSKYYDDKRLGAQTEKSQYIATNKTDRNRLKEVEKQLDKEEKKQKEKDILTDKLRVYRKVTGCYADIKEKIMHVVKDEIETNTWKMFDSMIWKKYTFKSLSIDDQYKISVLNINNKEMIGSLSATEYMALAYAFTLAIHEASGKNCPLVVDSPLGRVSDENREKMANELLKISKNKQIIMLFTPDEYSEEVKRVYEGNAASIRELSLTEDESEIDGGIN